MKAVLTTLGKFHSFDLARQLHARGALEAIYSGYPRFKFEGRRACRREHGEEPFRTCIPAVYGFRLA